LSNNNFEQLPLVPIDSISKKLNLVVGNKMILIAGRCKAIFDGRIKSTLAEGDRFLMIKKDLSIVLHGPIGVKPLNWQKPLAGPIEFKIADSLLEMITHRTKTKETLIITFTNLANISIWHATDESELEIYGDESDLVKFLVANPDMIEEGFQILRTEYGTDVGPVDIRGMSESGEVIVEVKKRNATPANAHQLKRYIEYFETTEKKSVRGILVAQEFPKKVLAYLEKNNLEAKIIHWKEIFPMIKRPKSAKLEDFFDKKGE
jgi:RecB family endonuclease NucS